MPASEAPDSDGRWIVPRGAAALLEELELCGVPASATAGEARLLLALNGVWVPEGAIALARAVRMYRESWLSSLAA